MLALANALNARWNRCVYWMRDALLDAAEVCDSREQWSIEFQLPQEAEHWRCLAATIRGLSERLFGTQEKSIREDCHK